MSHLLNIEDSKVIGGSYLAVKKLKFLGKSAHHTGFDGPSYSYHGENETRKKSLIVVQLTNVPVSQ